MKSTLRPLSSVAEIIAGQSPESDYYNMSGEGVPFFQGKADFNENYPTVRYYTSKITKTALPNDILLSVRAPVGPTNICNIESCIGRGLAAIRAGKELHFKYAYYFFKSIQERLAASGNGSTFSAITTSVVRDIQIPCPPLPIQKKIAAILDKADSLRQKDKQLLEHYNELAQSIFYGMFGDGTKANATRQVPLAECCGSEDDIKCGPFGTQLQVHEFRTEGHPLWGIKHVNKNFSIPTVEFLSSKKAEELKQYNILPNDLVMTRKGTIGNCAIYPSSFQEGIMHSDLLRLRLDDSKARPIFIASQFRYNKELVWQLQRISTGAIMAGINVGKLKRLQIQLPKMETQRKFEALMNKVGESKKAIEENALRTETLFQSLLQKAFKGELVKES